MSQIITSAGLHKIDPRTGVHTVVDPSTGRVVYANLVDRLPDLSVPEIFKHYRCRLLRDVDGGDEGIAPAGSTDVLTVQMTPAGQWYLVQGNVVWKSDAVQGTDFEILLEDEPGEAPAQMTPYEVSLGTGDWAETRQFASAGEVRAYVARWAERGFSLFGFKAPFVVITNLASGASQVYDPEELTGTYELP